MGNPQFQAQMQAKAAEPSLFGAICKIGCAGPMAFLFGIFLIVFGFYGFAVSGLVGLFLGLSVAGLLSGGAGLGKKKLPLPAFLGIAAVIAIVSTFAGPPLGTAWAKSDEEDRFEKLVSAMKKDSFDPENWKSDYFKPVDNKFRRPEWEGHYMVARVKKAKDDDVPGDLRQIMVEIDEREDVDGKLKKLFKKARKDASKAFSAYYAAAQKILYANVSGKRPFPVDPELRKAFSKILDDLANSSDGNVYVGFVNSTQLAKPAGSDKLLTQMRLAETSTNAKVIKQGDAFSPAYDQQRRDTFMQAMNESFRQVFESDGLLNLVPLTKADDHDDRIVFEVTSKIIRVNDYFRFTNNGTFAGFLFAIEVEWGFTIYDREGKVLYSPKPRRSSPAENVRVSSGPNDPDWAMYSVMMDSAYYNYSREMTGRFGLKPPPEKTRFTYTKPARGESLRSH